MRILSLLYGLLLLFAGGMAQAQPAAPVDAGLAQHLLDRLGYGPAPGEVERVRRLGVQAWIENQLAPPPLPRRLEAHLHAPTGEQTLLRAIASPRQLEEVLVSFWLRHYKAEEEAGRTVRAQVLGRFAGLCAALGRQCAGGSEAAAMRALVAHFVVEPSVHLQSSVAQVWQRTGGEQRTVLRLLLSSPEFLAPAQWKAKEKDGLRFMVSAVRASGLAVENVAPLLALMKTPFSDQGRSEFVELLVSGRLKLAEAPVQAYEYASSAPPLRTVDGQGTVSQPGPVLMAAPSPSAAAMAAARNQPAQPDQLQEQLSRREFLRY